MLKRLNPASVVAPFSRYSHAVIAPEGYRWLYISGQVPLDPASGELIDGGVLVLGTLDGEHGAADRGQPVDHLPLRFPESLVRLIGRLPGRGLVLFRQPVRKDYIGAAEYGVHAEIARADLTGLGKEVERLAV